MLTMSEFNAMTRYNPDGFPKAGMHVDPDGYWVGWDVYSMLLAEVKELREKTKNAR